MKQGTIVAILGVAALVAGSAIFVETTSLPKTVTTIPTGRATNKVVCTDSYSTNIAGSTLNGGGTSNLSGTSATTYMTTTDITETVGHAATTQVVQMLPGGHIYLVRTCTFVG